MIWRAGVIITVDYDGELTIEQGLVPKEDMKKLPQKKERGKGNCSKGRRQ
ncbi:hypothetical protein [Nitrosospira multiformis]|uniref:Chromosome partitioning protein, ParB family n=1 Tax=Nitrosospira multiformis TaxID=1231 RepID=A0A1I7HI50_9PROT|nr:hypothetical protein [Nitrosospira multiformis]SFU60440.1 chromosome partitioning protein, ParB family [Nitrosospira multiformis]